MLIMIIAAHNRGSNDSFDEKEMKFPYLFFLEHLINVIIMIYSHFFTTFDEYNNNNNI